MKYINIKHLNLKHDIYKYKIWTVYQKMASFEENIHVKDPRPLPFIDTKPNFPRRKSLEL